MTAAPHLRKEAGCPCCPCCTQCTQTNFDSPPPSAPDSAYPQTRERTLIALLSTPTGVPARLGAGSKCAWRGLCPA